MPRLTWSPQALGDVQRLYRFLALKNPAAARRAVQAIRETVQVVSQHPAVGRPVDEMENEYREWLVDFGDSGYVLFYRVDANNTFVLAVRHQRETGY